MNKKFQSIIYIVLGIFLSTTFWLLVDWYDVKINRIQLNDFVFWVVWLLLSGPLIFTGMNKLINKKIISVLLTVVSLFILAVISIFLVLNFHLWIGGEL